MAWIPSLSSEAVKQLSAGATEWWIYFMISFALILFSGLTSGLTMGLMSFDELQLLVLQETGDSKQKKRARQIFKLVQKHHLLLVTLLLSNCAAMEALPIFLDQLVPSWVAILLSVTFIFIFGEVLPQALCTGPNQLKVASAMVPLVRVLIFFFFLLSWPISKILDWLFGTNEDHYYARDDLKALIGLHQIQLENDENEASSEPLAKEQEEKEKYLKRLGAEEVIVIQGALDMAEKTIQDLMVPIEDVFMMEFHTELTPDIMKLIFNSGHSRIPIYEGRKNNIKGVLLTKSLILVDPSEGNCLSKFLSNGRIRWSSMPVFTAPKTNPYILLNEFSQGKSHLAFVTNYVEEYQRCWEKCEKISSEATLLGIVTLEDVIEELIQSDITDEFDRTDRPSCILTSTNSAKLRLKSFRDENTFSKRRISSMGDTDRALYSYRNFNKKQSFHQQEKRIFLDNNSFVAKEFSRGSTSNDENLPIMSLQTPLLDNTQHLEAHASLNEDTPYIFQGEIQEKISRTKSSRMWPSKTFNVHSYKKNYYPKSSEALRSFLATDEV